MGSIAANRGLGLIELLIATALGLSLATGVIQIYATNSLAARDLETRIRVQENGRLALHFLMQELRSAASPDCTREQWLTLTEASADLPFRNILGWEAADTAPGDSLGSTLHDAAAEVIDSHQGNWLSSAGSLESLSLLPGSDVIGLFSPCEVEGSSAPEDDVRHGTYFYVGKRGDSADNPPSLFRHNGTGSSDRSEELFEGVASLQALYGVARGGGNQVTDYVVASQVVDWHRVSAVRISLLLQSVDDSLLAVPQSYDFHGVRYDGTPGNGPAPVDRRLRRVFSTTLALPERLAPCGSCLAGATE